MLSESKKTMGQADTDVCQIPPPSKRRRLADGGGLLKLPNDLLRILVEGMLGSEEGGAEQVVRTWLSLRLACKHLWELIVDVPLDLRFSAPLTDAQVVWMMEADVKLRSVVFSEKPMEGPLLWLEVGCVRRRPTAICRSRDTLEKLQGLVLGREKPCEYRTPLLAEMASELGSAAFYDLQGFTRLTSLSLRVDNDAAFPLPPSLEVLRLSFERMPREREEQGLASAGMGPVSLPRLRSLQVRWTFTAGTRWLPFLVPSVEAVSMSSEPFGMCPSMPPQPGCRCWGHATTMVNVKILVFKNIRCPLTRRCGRWRSCALKAVPHASPLPGAPMMC
eukprot:jgi/Botrbrau1/13550/Bobra.4_2s0008.1